MDDLRTSSCGGNSEVVSQVKSLFDSLAQSLEVRFSNIDNWFSQVLSGNSGADK